MTDLARRLAVARGDEPADTVVRGGRVFCVFTREWLDADVAIADGVIAGVGDYDGSEVVDASGRFVVPGFVDAHMHIESVKLLVDELERLVLPLGTTAIVADPHEIANVLGSDGVHWLLDACDRLQLDVYFMAPSCVPASPFESPRRPLTPGDLEALMRRNRVLGLAEMMNFPGVVAGAPVGARASSRSKAPSTSTATRPGCSARACRRMPQPASAPTTSASPPRRDASGCGRGCGSSSARRRWRATSRRSSRSRSSTAPTGSRSARTTATPTTSPTTATSTGSCARRCGWARLRRTRS